MIGGKRQKVEMGRDAPPRQGLPVQRALSSFSMSVIDQRAAHRAVMASENANMSIVHAKDGGRRNVML